MYSDMLSKIRPFVIDAVFYGILRNEQVSEDVKSFLPPSTIGCNFILPLWDSFSEAEMALSFNFCDFPPKPYQFTKYKLGAPTMGRSNDCTRQTDFQINKVEQSKSREPDNLVGVTSEPLTEDDCLTPNPNIGYLHNEIVSQISHIQKNYDLNYTYEFYPTENFQKQVWKKHTYLLETGGNLSNSLLPFEEMSGIDLKKTSDYALPGATYHRCALCHRRMQQCPESFHHNQKHPYTQALVNGIELPTHLSDKQRRLSEHINSQMHLTSVFHMVEKDRINLEIKASGTYKTNITSPAELQTIANIIDVTFTFIHTNTAPSNAEYWYKTLRKISAKIGGSHHSRRTAFSIIKHISSLGTNALMNQISENRLPFSLILDGSSDSRNRHFVLVYIQTLENEVTIPYYLFTLELQTSFTAEAYLKVLKEAIASKGLWFQYYFANNIVGIISDSAKVMVKFHELLKVVSFVVSSSGCEISLTKTSHFVA